jgi:hypothetical protein
MRPRTRARIGEMDVGRMGGAVGIEPPPPQRVSNAIRKIAIVYDPELLRSARSWQIVSSLKELDDLTSAEQNN